jgi:hypothetical protein
MEDETQFEMPKVLGGGIRKIGNDGIRLKQITNYV